MIEQSTENSFSQDSSIKTEQVRRQNGNELHHGPDHDERFPALTQLSKQIEELDEKSIRIEDLISSIKKDIKSAVTTLDTNYQITSDSSTKFVEFHKEIAQLQMQIQKIELAISDVYKSKNTGNTKKASKDKKLKKKAEKLNKEVQVKEKMKNKKKSKKMKKKKKQK
ncbi:MAG TPA: hypothetical protein VH796_18210 [Nitrososphaeraceae archaeon]|jgi:chromosome segregation ATPase